MAEKNEYSKYFKPIKEAEMQRWQSAPKSITTELFESFLASKDTMVEVNAAALPPPKHKASKLKSTKQDSFASSFYAWKRKRKKHIDSMGFNILLVRRGEKMALKKVKKK